MKLKFILFLPVVFLASILRAETLENVIKSADICRTEYVKEGQLPLYLGNGRFGGCIEQKGECSLMHVGNYGRGRYEMDYLLPVAKLHWAEASGSVSRYSQHQSMYDGIVTTSFTDDLGQLKIKEWFDASERNLFVMQIEKTGKARQLVIEFPIDVKTHYGSRFHGEVSYQKVNNGWTVTTSLSGSKKEVGIITSAAGDIVDENLALTVRSGDYVAISYGISDFENVIESSERTRKWWNAKWKEAPMVFVPDCNVQNLFIRSLAQLFSTCNEDGIGLMPPCGLSGNAWPFPFPHDLSFILSTLLSAGSYDIAKSWVEYFARDTEGLREYTRHIFGVDGIFAPWCYPYGGLKGLNWKGVPNRAFYEIHNSGHLCRMAYETSLFINDSGWTEKYAKPLVKGCVEFYQAMLIKESDGLWHIFHIPSFGQDENGGSNQKDYLDALYSARYCLETAVRMGIDSDGKCAEILSDGLAFQTLKSSRGYYVSCFGRGESDFGNQKHPVQLNEITLLPMDGGISAEARKAYQDRYDITERASEPFSRGWTCGSFILASARMGDPQGWIRDWSSLVPADAVDKDYIQYYESSGLHNKAYFITNSGLFVGSLLTCAVNDWEGEIRIGSCDPWNKLSFNNIWSKLGVVVSGTAGQKATITAWKDCSVRIEGELYTLKKGQQIVVDLSSQRKSNVSQLHLPSHQTVDLGLSVNWSAMNVGATAENQYGDVFAFEDASACNSGGFSIPSIANWQELISKCKWIRANVNGIEGYKVVSKVPGYTDRQIFLPLAGCRTGSQYHSRGIDGYYWSSSELEGKNQYAWSILATSGHVYKSDSYKFIKQSVRLVASKPESDTKKPVLDYMKSSALSDTHIMGPVELKMENFFDHRIYSQFARDSIFGEAYDAFVNRVDDIFKAPAGYWQGEFWGKLMMGASRVAMYKNSQELLNFIKEEAQRMIALQEPDGYLGTYSNKTFVTSPDPEAAIAALGWKCDYNWNLWCRKYTMWGLLQCYEATGEKAFLDAVVKSMDQEIAMLDSLGTDVWNTGTAKFLGLPSCSVLKPLMQLYRLTGYGRYLSYAEKIVGNWDCSDRHAPALIANAFTDTPVCEWYGESATWAKAYEMMSCLDGLLEYYRIVGDKRILDAVIRIQQNLWQSERNQMWSVGYNDKFSGGAKYPNGISEPCDVIHWIRLNYDLFLITGDPSYVDIMELSFFNAFLAGVFREGDWGARGVRTEGYHNFAQGQSGMKYNHCCVDNMPRCFMDVAQTLITSDKKGCVYINWYSDFEASIDGVQVKVSGNYPICNRIAVEVSCEGKRHVCLRVPSWCEQMTVNGSKVEGAWFSDTIDSSSSFDVEFLMTPKVVRSDRQTIERYGNPDFRKDRWICGDKDLTPYLRRSPCCQITRGPIVLAKSVYIGDTKEQIRHTAPLDMDIEVVDIMSIDAPEVWGAWTITLSDGTVANVCDYGSACDTKHKERGYQFSIYF